MSSRYRFRQYGEKNLEDGGGYATRDAAVSEANRRARRLGIRLLVIDTHDSPHRVVGLADTDEWRPPISICKECKGKQMLPKTYTICDDCEGLGVKLEKARWKG